MSPTQAPGPMAGDCVTSNMWNWNTIGACFLTPEWYIRNDGMMAASCIGATLLTVLLECCRRAGREYDDFIVSQMERSMAAGEKISAPSPSSTLSPLAASTGKTVTMRASPFQQLARAFIHAITFGVAYITMLLAMYFNGYIILCLFIGAGIGKFLCDWLVVRVEVHPSELGQIKGKQKMSERTTPTTYCCS
ncbi:hypothetical protein MAPG_01420 [Magnaporthiopsis poae ATCC 64411]|uniref:Copper transport protein n=1 Tax=Magnaporthiopsis poae (strain ATCC 64411 / 73-15) TaxID=644358 RepID=A0A0C4DNM8_MAGP6|nr:hypothetical protein MAPG_01420 [Magnaporthiopsis poae ATCC 64411]